jgi:hypothetical protein
MSLPQFPDYSRRQMLLGSACGFGYLALAGLLASGSETPGGFVSPVAPKPPQFPAKAKRVIFLFMQGAPSHVDLFDYKPKLIADGGKPGMRGPLLAPQWNFRRSGKSGLYISDLFPDLSKHADDMCILNGMYTDNPAHPQATIQMHTGSVRFVRPSMGAWILYGLGTENQNLPGFITINPPPGVGGAQNYGSGFLPAAFEGTRIDGDGSRLIPNVTSRVPASMQRKQIDLIQLMNQDMLNRSGQNAQIEGVIASYELGFRMQSTVPAVMDTAKESPYTLDLYGIGEGKTTNTFGRQCLMARRFAEAGVRFIEVGFSGWDQHNQLRTKHAANAHAVDRPIAGLLADLKQRDMLKDTLVIWGGEFGRTPWSQNGDGRDHNAKGFSMWMAGGGAKGGMNYGATDDYGYKAVTDSMHIHDLHATILAMLGLDHEKLTYRYAGRDFRLTETSGIVQKAIIA